MDQFVFNHGPEAARRIAHAWCEVGAVENGELLARLADALQEQPPAEGETVDAFMRFRAHVGGPTFEAPPPDEELEEVLLEWALEHPERFEQDRRPITAAP